MEGFKNIVYRYEEGETDKKSDDKLAVSFNDIVTQMFDRSSKNSMKLSANIVTWEVGIYCMHKLEEYGGVFKL